VSKESDQLYQGVFDDVRSELFRAMRKHAPMYSPHDGYGKLLEEVEELWDEIRKKEKHHSKERMRGEAIQIAAMALRFIIEVLGG